MVIKVGINGFGRIGRIIFRTCVQKLEIQLSAINDPAIDIEYICYLIKFDSTHGKFRGNISHTDDEITVNDQKIKVFREKLPSDIPWHKADVQYVIEASGIFTSLDKSSGHLASQGVKRVIVTAPSVDVPMIVLGVNDNILDTDQKVISCASSTLYCLAPIVKVLHDQCGVVEGFITSIHAMTPSLKPLDGLCLRGKHWRDHRSITQNIIPATTGACRALGKILPSVKDKMAGLAFRVPTADVSVLDLTIRLKADTTKKDIIKFIEKASTTTFRNIIHISNEQSVSSDFIGDSHSCIVDVDSSIQLTANFFKIICWYENEYSYSCRVIDTIFFSEMQLAHSIMITTKPMYVRPEMQRKKTTRKCEGIKATPAPEICINSNDNTVAKSKSKAQVLSLKKPMTSDLNIETITTETAKDTKRDNKTCEVRNECCETPKNSVTFEKTSISRSCTTISHKHNDNEGRSVKTEQCLESVNNEISKMHDVTKELLDQCYGFKLESSYCNTNSNLDVNNESKLDGDNDNKKTHNNDKLKRDYQIYKNSGDFKKVCRSQCNYNFHIETNFLNRRKANKSEIFAFKEIDRKHIENDQCKTKRMTERPILIESKKNSNHTDMSNTDKSSDDKPNTAGNTVNSNKNTNLVDVNSDINTKATLISPKVIAEATRPIENVNNDTASAKRDKNVDNKSNKSILNVSNEVHEKIVPNNIVRQVHFKLCEVDTNDNQNSECDLSISEGKTELNNIENMSKYFERKSNNIRIIDEELKKRNITLVSSNSNTEMSIMNSEMTSKTSLSDQSKMDLNAQNVIAWNTYPLKAQSFGFGCDSPETVTTISNGERIRVKRDLYDKLDSESESDSNNSFQINAKKSQVLHISDLTNSLEDVSRLDQICRIIEISDELSDQLFSRLDDSSTINAKRWSFKDLCERIKLDEFCNNLFGKIGS